MSHACVLQHLSDMQVVVGNWHGTPPPSPPPPIPQVANVVGGVATAEQCAALYKQNTSFLSLKAQPELEVLHRTAAAAAALLTL